MSRTGALIRFNRNHNQQRPRYRSNEEGKQSNPLSSLRRYVMEMMSSELGDYSISCDHPDGLVLLFTHHLGQEVLLMAEL
ncbi:hypothetical protein J6590_005900 [Homalodisca vitripennis]|nr:hypothetical protein J6590_005900 [Homalodisca vitripennis]